MKVKYCGYVDAKQYCRMSPEKNYSNRLDPCLQVECETRMKAIELKEICVDIDIQLPREECRKEEREECR